MPSASSGIDIRLRARFARRWYVAAAGLAATAILCIAVALLVPVKYSAKAYFILTPPVTTGSDNAPNPYLGLGGLRPLAEVISQSLMTGSTLRELRAAGMTGSYTVAPDPTTDSPIIVVKATGDSSGAALHNVRLVLGLAPRTLANLQDTQSVAASARVTTQAISTPTRADPARKPQIRALAVAFAAGVICTSLAVCVLDIVLLRRRRRNDEPQSDNTSAHTENEPSGGEGATGRSPSRAEQADATSAAAPEDAAAGAETTGDRPEPDTHHALAGARRRESGPPRS